MSTPAATYGRAPAVPTSSSAPVWLLLGFVVLGMAFTAAVAAGGYWPLTALVLTGVSAAFVVVLRLPHAGISLFLTTFLINYPSVARGAGPLTINNILGGLFLVLLLWDFYLHRDAWFLNDRLLHWLLGIGVIFLVGSVASVYTLPDEHVQRLIQKPIGAVYGKTDYTSRFLFQYFSRIAFLLFMLRFIRTPRQLQWVFVTMLFCILFAVPPAMHTYITAQGTDVRALTKLVNWADNANRFAFGVLLGIAFFYYLAISTQTTWVKVVSMLGALALTPAILLSASRSGFMGMVLLGLMVMLGMFGGTAERSRRANLAGLVVVLAVGLVTYFTILPPRMQERILNLNPFATQAEGAQSTEFRYATIENSFQIIGEHPIMGVGLGNFRWVHKYTHGRFKPPHNSYVWALAEGGVPLLLAFLGLYYVLWRRLGRLREAYANHDVIPFFPNWLRVYIVLLLFFSFFADVWIEEHVFLLVGSTILLEYWCTHPPATAPAVAPALAPAHAKA
jgi:O-antigen ligase